MSCGSVKLPGSDPICPHALTNFPSREYLTTRALLDLFREWPSATKISPFAPTATPVGRSNRYGPFPPTPSVPIVISTLPVGLILRTARPMVTPRDFFTGYPGIVSCSLVSVVLSYTYHPTVYLL